jgi:ribokinase
MYLSHLPQIGETVSGHRCTTGPGGKGSNQAVAAARLGAQVTFIGRVGQDSFANIGLHLWEAEGINTRYVARDPHNSTGLASIFVDEAGEDMIGLALGANMALCPDDVDAAADAIKGADALLVQLEIPLETVAHALKVAKNHRVKTILNPGPAQPLTRDLLALADYLTPNEQELETVALKHSSVMERAAQSLLVADEQTVMVTMGAGGALRVCPEGSRRVPAYIVDVVDTVGGGDAFSAGLAVALAEGREPDDAVLFANAVAGLCVSKPGAAASMPHRHEVDTLQREQGGAKLK